MHKACIKYCIIAVCILSSTIKLFATHNRAGEITFELIKGFTYRITVTTYTNTKPPSTGNQVADRDYLTVSWGDNTYEEIPRVSKVDLPDDYRKNTYVKEKKTFPGPGLYKIVMSDPYRNEDVDNIPSPLDTEFTLETLLLINSSIGENKAPVLLYQPTDKAALGKTFIHNPTAYDPDGDSISYRLTESKGARGNEIPGYVYPRASKKLYVNEVTGDLVWDAPVELGTYNVAMEIIEWRGGIAISKILRDIQITVEDVDDNPPEINPVLEQCLIAGDTLTTLIYSRDIDGDNMQTTAYGEPFDIKDNASFINITNSPGYIVDSLVWITNCNHIKKQPYQIVIKAEELSGSPKLFDIENVFIKVLGPSPVNVSATTDFNSINISWDSSACGGVNSYRVYRSIQPVVIEDECLAGLPFEEYQIVETVDANQFSFKDNTVKRGVKYYYRIVPVYGKINLAEGIASEEVFAILPVKEIALLKTSVEAIDSLNGEIEIGWTLRHSFIDTLINSIGYKVYRKSPLENDFELISEWVTTSLNDTSILDKGLNTYNFSYSYAVELFWVKGNEEVFIASENTSSTFLTIKSGDKKLYLSISDSVPWQDTLVTFCRYNANFDTWDTIGKSDNGRFVDRNLSNGTTYWYKALTDGYRIIDSTYRYTVNWSHPNFGIPRDTIPPCAPKVNLSSECEEFYNTITWYNSEIECGDDIKLYRIYYANAMDKPLELIDSVSVFDEKRYVHVPDTFLAGCYQVAAVDSSFNETRSEKVCIDICEYYKLPNVFSPNFDQKYDLFAAEYDPFMAVKSEIKVYNRYGTLVFESEELPVNWNGTTGKSDKICSPGVYYYVSIVYERRLTGIEPRTLTGFIYLFTDKDKIHQE